MTLEELVRDSEVARLQLTESHANFRRALDFPARAKQALLEQPVKWIGGTLAAGIVGSFLFGKKQKPPAQVKTLKRQRGFLLGLLSLALAMGKPLAKVYATKLVRSYLSARFMPGARSRLAGAGKRPY